MFTSIIEQERRSPVQKQNKTNVMVKTNDKTSLLLMLAAVFALLTTFMFPLPVFAKTVASSKKDVIAYSSFDNESVRKSGEEWFTYKEIDEIKNDVTIFGVIPVIEGLGNNTLQNMLNESIEAEYNKTIEIAGNKQLTISFSCEMKQYDNFVSILLRSVSTGSAAADSIKSFNFDKESNQLITINSVLGINGVKLINRALSEETKNNIDKYNANFLGIDDTHDFYVEDGKLYIVFDKYEIAPGYAGVIEFPVTIDNISSVTVTSYPKTNYKTRMIMLKQVTDAFGYLLTWDSETRTTVVMSPERNVITSITIGKNEYTRNGIIVPALEHYPEITDDRTYVPVAFFEDVLDLSYSVAPNGDIVISRYGNYPKTSAELSINTGIAESNNTITE